MPEQSRLKSSLEMVILQTLPGVDFYAQYPGTIVAQNGQLFDFKPDNPDWPGIQGIKFYSGTPGIEITVDPSMSPRAVLFFEGYQPSAPALGLFGAPGLVDYTLTASGQISLDAPSVKVGSNASLAAARVTDPVEVAPSMATWISAVTAALAAVPTPAVVPPPTDFGTIETGSNEVVLG